jgi:septum formation protein
MAIVLASASPRRQELLKCAGIEFVVKPANIPEIPEANEPPRAFAERLAREKAHAVWSADESQCVLGADTVVVAGDELLGKPESENDAERMLRLLSGRVHEVTTGVCLLGRDFEDVRSATTKVHFRKMREEEIRDYVRSGEPMDKAGAYAIQGGASRWVTKIEGDYSNVVGLPVELVLQMLRACGVIAS